MKQQLLKHIIYVVLMVIPFLSTSSQNIQYTQTVEVPVQFNPQTSGTAKIEIGKKVQLTGMAFSPDDKLLATGGYKEICLWSLESPELKQRFSSPLINGHVRAVQFINQHTLAIGCGEPGFSGQVHIINLKKQAITSSFYPSNDIITKIAVSPVTDIISAADASGKIFLFNLTENRLMGQAEQLSSEITSLTFLKDTFKIAYCSTEGQMMVWDIKTQSPYYQASFERQLMGLQMVNNKKGVLLINNKQKRTLQSFQAYNNTGAIKRIKKNPSQNKNVNLVAHRPTKLVTFNKGQQHALACSDGSLLVYSSVNNGKKFTMHGHDDWISALELSNNESIMASADTKGIIKIWSLSGRQVLLTLIQIANGYDEWLAISSRGYYKGSSAQLLQWKDQSDIPPYLQNKLYNPAKLDELANTSRLKAPRQKNKSKR